METWALIVDSIRRRDLSSSVIMVVWAAVSFTTQNILYIRIQEKYKWTSSIYFLKHSYFIMR